MIDGRRFGRGANLDERALQEVTVRRLKAELREKDFQPRRLATIPFTPAAEEQERFLSGRPAPAAGFSLPHSQPTRRPIFVWTPSGLSRST